MSVQITVPTKTLPVSGASSSWFAANGQLTSINVLMLRRDALTTIVSNNASKYRVVVGQNLNGIISIVGGDSIYINHGTLDIVLTVVSVSFAGLTTTIDCAETYIGATITTSGYINFLTARPNYYISIQYLKYNTVSAIFENYGARYLYRTNSRGLSTVDVSAVFRNMTSVKDEFAHDVINKRDTNLSAFGAILIRQGWSIASVPTDAVGGALRTFNIVNAAMQMRHIYGSNMADYMPENTGQDYAKFCTDFVRPTYFKGFPFDVSFIYEGQLDNVPFLKRFYESYIQDLPINIDNDLLDNSQGTFLNRLMLSKYYVTGVDKIHLFLGYDGFGTVKRYVGYNYVTDGYFQAI